jgi:hypothetical protein
VNPSRDLHGEESLLNVECSMLNVECTCRPTCRAAASEGSEGCERSERPLDSHARIAAASAAVERPVPLTRHVGSD